MATTTLSARGQVVIPSEVREKLGLRKGDDFLVLNSDDGDILLRPIRRGPRKTLWDAFRALKGLELPPRNKELIRPIKL
jgi:AbrB family looped-hinge helix DNA binding protein